MYNTVIFDLDGTLLNTLDDLCASVNYALEANGYPTRTIEEVRRFLGNGVAMLIERAVPEGTGKSETEKTLAVFKAHYQEHCNDLTAPYDGIMPLLRELKSRGVKLGIASNKIKSAVEKLNEICFDGIIDAAEGVTDGNPTKPDPYMIQNVLRELNTDAEHTLYVGDSQVDVMTAKNAGLNMVTVLWGFRDYEELCEAGAKNFVREPSEILRYI